MFAMYIGPTIYAGPKDNRQLLIKHGEVRKIHAKGTDGRYILSGKNNKGFFGWVDSVDIKLI